MNGPKELDRSDYPQLFVVVCTDYHTSAGPFTSAEEAVHAARVLSRETSCRYIPVPLRIDPAKTTLVSADPEPEDEGWRHRHGYL